MLSNVQARTLPEVPQKINHEVSMEILQSVPPKVLPEVSQSVFREFCHQKIFSYQFIRGFSEIISKGSFGNLAIFLPRIISEILQGMLPRIAQGILPDVSPRDFLEQSYSVLPEIFR